MKEIKIKNQEIFIKPSDREEYFRKNKICVKRLGNGVTIIGITREVCDVIRASIQFIFPTGCFYDPKGKRGLHHLVEHLFYKSLTREAGELGVGLNASLFDFSLNGECWGTVNPKVKEYGLWPILPKIIKSISSPLIGLKDPENLIAKEKNILISEDEKNRASYQWHVGRFWREVNFGRENPVNTYPCEVPEELVKISIKDIEEFIRNVLIPDGLVVSVLCEASEETTKELVNYLADVLMNFPIKEQKSHKLDWSLLEINNPSFSPGTVYKKDTKITNHLVSVILGWRGENRPYTPFDLAFNRYAGAVSRELFMVSRKMGWSYSYDVLTTSPGLFTQAFGIRLDVSKKDLEEIEKFAKKFWAEAKKKILRFNSRRIKIMLEKEQRRQKADPILVDDRLYWMVKGLRRWGMMIDVDKVREIYGQITTKDIEEWQERFIKTPPAEIIIGDLS